MSKHFDSLNFVDVSYKISEISFVVAYTVENFRVTRSHDGLGQLFKKSYPEHLKGLKVDTQLSGFTVTSPRPGNGLGSICEGLA